MLNLLTILPFLQGAIAGALFDEPVQWSTLVVRGSPQQAIASLSSSDGKEQLQFLCLAGQPDTLEMRLNTLEDTSADSGSVTVSRAQSSGWTFHDKYIRTQDRESIGRVMATILAESTTMVSALPKDRTYVSAYFGNGNAAPAFKQFFTGCQFEPPLALAGKL